MIRPVRLLGHVRVSQASDAVTIRGLTAPVANGLVEALTSASVMSRSTGAREHASEFSARILTDAGFTVTREVSP